MLPGTYHVSTDLLAREDFHDACAARDFATVFRLMRKYDGVSQDRISSPVDGLTQSRVSRIVRGDDHISGIDLVERICDSLGIPGGYVGLAARPWETPTPTSSGASPQPQPPVTLGQIVEEHTLIDVDIPTDGKARVTYHHTIRNDTPEPFTRLLRELWFRNLSGPITVQALPGPDHNVIIEELHDAQNIMKFACQILPAVQPGHRAEVIYTSTGALFSDQLFWRQAITRPTEQLTIRVRHHGLRALTQCTATEELPSGTVITASEDLSLTIQDNCALIEVTRRHLHPNQAVTLRWDHARA